MRRFWIFLMLLVSFAQSLDANVISFKHLGTQDGLSYGQVNHIAKDSQGFLWISTSAGLNRYDGHTFKIFTSGGEYSLPDNNIYSVQEDSDKKLWIQTNKYGYYRYDPLLERFYSVDSILAGEYGVKSAVSNIFIDKYKNIWFHTYVDGVYFYDIAKRETIHYEIDQQERLFKSVAEDKDGAVYLYDDGTIWTANQNNKVFTKKTCHLAGFSVTEKRYSKVSLFVDSKDDYWVFTNDQHGLWFYDTSVDGGWEHYNTSDNSRYKLSSNYITDIDQVNENEIWIATEHSGIDIIDIVDGNMTNLRHDAYDDRSIIQNSIYELFYDDDSGIVWVGAQKMGISYYNDALFKFNSKRFFHIKNDDNLISDINVIAQDNHNGLWLGTNGDGLIYSDGERYEYLSDEIKGGLSADYIVTSLLIDKTDIVWFGTFQSGLCKFDGEKVTNYRVGDGSGLASNDVWALTMDSKGGIWIGTLGGGLQRFDAQKRRFVCCASSESALSKEYVTSICIGRDDNIYFSTESDVYIYYPNNYRFEKIRFGVAKNSDVLRHPTINQIIEDRRGNLWIATQRGLFVFDKQRNCIDAFGCEELIGREAIHGVVEDENGNIWATTNRRVVSIVISQVDDGYAYRIRNYDTDDGLQNQIFNLRSIISRPKGEIIMGGTNGLSLIDYNNITYNDNVPNVVFTSLDIYDEIVEVDSLYSGRKILSRAINHSDKIVLKHHQNMISIGFSSMNYILPNKTKYSCMLEGFDSKWFEQESNKVTYANLPPGHYTLKVKAINGDGVQSKGISTLFITIKPPFLRSTIAYVIYVILVILLLILARYIMLKEERQKYKQKQVERDVQRMVEVNDMKLRFFTNISHELRTPLSLIISPLESLLDGRYADYSSQRESLEMIHRNSVRLFDMVNQLLDFRKAYVKEHQLNLSHGDMVEYLRSITDSFVAYSQKKGVHLTYFSSEREIIAFFDRNKIGKIVTNLLSNAFKFSADGGRVDLSIGIVPNDEPDVKCVEIRVADSGIGISDSDKSKIFERFYQAGNNTKNEGCGIGLHLVNEFVSLHRGNITVLDNVEKGSVFVVRLNLDTDHSTISIDDDKVNQTDNIDVIDQENETIDCDSENSLDHDSIDQDDNLEMEVETDIPTILVVDDSDDIRAFIRSVLSADFRVVEAINGAVAWDMLPTLHPDIIISDVMMPEMDGCELCRLAKSDSRTSHLPFMLLTVRSADEHKMAGFESGADEYLTKPFNVDIFLYKVKRLIEQRKLRQRKFRGKMDVSPSEITITSLDEKLIQKAINYVESNIERTELTVVELSEEMGMSRVHLYKKLLSITGKTPIEFIRIIRLKRASQLLRESQLSVAEIAYQVGFNSPKYFSKYFSAEFGVLPSEYQKKSGQ